MTTLFAVLALAGLFVLFGLLPGTRNGCDGCEGGCSTCSLDEEQAG